MESKRNITLDYFKLILSFLVILLHSYPLFNSFPTLSNMSWLISNGIARIAVPCFFLINGFYLIHKKTSNRFIFKNIKRLLVMYIIWILIYSYSIKLETQTLYTVCKQIFLGYAHLWYLLSYAQALLLFWLLKKLKISDFLLLIISIILYIIGFFIQRHYMALDSVNTYFYNTYSRNAVFFALPFLSIGFLIAKHKIYLLRISRKYLLFSLIILFCILLIESYFYSIIKWRMDFLLSIFILSPLLFIYVLKISKYIEVNSVVIVSQIATCVYLIHSFCLSFVESFARNENSFFSVIFVFFLSMILSYPIVKVNEKVRIFL